MTTAKKPTTPSVATLTKKLKAAEAEIAGLENLIFKLNEKHANELADYGNEQYGLGLEQGRLEMSAAFEAQSRIQRWMYKA